MGSSAEGVDSELELGQEMDEGEEEEGLSEPPGMTSDEDSDQEGQQANPVRGGAAGGCV